MPAWGSKSVPAIQRFWDKYIILLGKQGIKPGQHRWYVRHIRLLAFIDRRLVALAQRIFHTAIGFHLLIQSEILPCAVFRNLG